MIQILNIIIIIKILKIDYQENIKDFIIIKHIIFMIINIQKMN